MLKIDKKLINKFEKNLFKIDEYKVTRNESMFFLTNKKERIQLQFYAFEIHENVRRAIKNNSKLTPQDFVFSIKNGILLVLNKSDDQQLTKINPIGSINFIKKPLYPFPRL